MGKVAQERVDHVLGALAADLGIDARQVLDEIDSSITAPCNVSSGAQVVLVQNSLRRSPLVKGSRQAVTV